MYCTYYKFSEKPFDVTPDPRFLYLTEGHRETLASLIYGIRERRGFITIVGEVGTGKTTLLNAALDRLDDKTKVAFIFNTDVNFDEMLSMALYEWGLVKSQESLSKVNAVQRLNDFAIQQLAKGGNVVLIVDEAQNLDNSVMENLRLLSNLETRRHKLVQIVLSGQPEFDTKLDQHELRQLAQRISLRRYVFPLDEMDTYAYLEHRLNVAKHKNSSLFTVKAQKLIWEYSGGVPRKINILCDNAFLIGYGLKKNKINSAIVQEAAQDLKWRQFSDTKVPSNFFPPEIGDPWTETKPPRRPLKLTAAMIIAGLLIFAGSFLLNERGFQFAKLTGFIRNIRGPAVETVHPDPTKAQVRVPSSDTPAQAILKPKMVRHKVAKENLEPETRAKIKEVPYLTVSKYHIVNEKSLDLIVQDNETENMWQVTALKKNDRSEIQVINEEKQDLSVPVKKEIKVRNVKVKKGDTLHRIIIQTYGAYDHMTLNEVLRENPKIIDPDRILAGQIIKIPVNRGQMSGVRDQGSGVGR